MLLLLFSGQIYSEEEQTPQQMLQTLEQQLDTAEQALKNIDDDTDKLDKLAIEITQLEQQALACIIDYEKKQQQSQNAIDSLGEAPPDEDVAVTRKRNDLEKQKKDTDNILSQCRLLELRASTLLEDTRAAHQSLRHEQLFGRVRSALDHAQTLLDGPQQWQTEFNTIRQNLLDLKSTTEKDATEGFWTNLWKALGFGAAGMIIGFFWSTRKRRLYRSEKTTLFHTSPTLEAVWRSLLRVMPYALFAGLAFLSLYIAPVSIDAFRQLALTLLVFSLSYAFLHSLLRTQTRIEGVIPANSRASRALYRWARLLTVTTLVGVVLHADVFDLARTQQASTIALLRIACGTLIAIALTRFIWLLSEHLLIIQRTRLHLVTALILLVAVISQWTGYRNFSTFLYSGVFGSLFLLLAAWLLLRIPAEIFDGLDEGRAPWQQKLREQLGLKSGQLVPGLVWLRLVNVLLVAGGGLLLLLRLWGMPDQNLTLLMTKLETGFEIAGFNVEPLRIINGLLVIALLVSLTHVFKRYLGESWLERTSLSRSAREATTTVSGYIGILIAVLLGLSVAGIELANLALIAGALSVGIGFGLQNIVNNFVSGLILLFERPIRRGDWVKVGGIQGHVKRISIRSTTIQTFDREDVIIPNSEFISGQVTNMELSNPYGRIIIPVGVAYGSDTALVMQLLADIAKQHPETLYEQGEAKVMALFQGFGDSSLNFELYCQIRDVSNKLRVQSDLNLAIDKAFREHNIEIPFPQRVIHTSTKTQTDPVKTADLG